MKIQMRKFSFSNVPPLSIGSENGDRPQLWGPPSTEGRGILVGCHLWGCRVRHDCSDLAAAAVMTITKRIKEDEETAVKARSPNPSQVPRPQTLSWPPDLVVADRS